jgi:TonB-dependent receptor
LLGLDYALNAGMRYVHTHQASYGLNSGTVVNVSRNYDDWLPALNLALFPTRDIVLRGAISKVMTRPALGNVTPGGSADGFNYRVTFGNPRLEPFRATAFDAAVEWYFAPQSILSVALFKKNVSSFPVAVTQSNVSFTSTGLPSSVLLPSSPAITTPGQLSAPIWTVTTTGNGAGASLKGAELSVQAPFRFLPGFLSNFGGIANATFISSSAGYRPDLPAITPGGGLQPSKDPRNATLFGVSKRAYNATLYYEDKKFSARASISYRSGYIDANSGTGNVFEGYNSITNVDASLRYRITEQLELSLEGTNLTDAYRDRYVDVDANRNYEYNHFGRTFLMGARFKM